MLDLINQVTDGIRSKVIPFPSNAKSSTEDNLASGSADEVEIPTPIYDALIAEAKELDRISSYKTSFDYKVYRSLERRFSKRPVRGGIICKTDLKLANFHSSCFKCHYTLELDTYGRGCSHDCGYCYAKDELSLHGYWNNPIPFPINVNKIRKIFYKVFETDKTTKWRPILEKRIPIRIGSMSDSFMWSELKHGVTYEVIKILNHYKYPHIIFTRSDLVAHDKYISVLDPKLASVQFSICGGNEDLTQRIEPGAPSILRRLTALRKLADYGFWTAVRINPLFPTYPDGYFSDNTSVVERFGGLSSVPKFEFFDIGKVDAFMEKIADAGVKTVLAGFVRLKSSSLNTMMKTSGIDLWPFFRPEVVESGLRGNREKKYSDAEISRYYLKISSAVRAAGLRFSSCYIGNGAKDYYQYQKLWDNKSDCCDVRGNVAAFQSSAQDIPWDVRAKHTPNPMMAQASEREEKALDSQYINQDTTQPKSQRTSRVALEPEQTL